MHIPRSLRFLLLLLPTVLAVGPIAASAGTVRIKVVTVFSNDPDDQFADRIELIGFQIGSVTGTTGDNDDSTPVGDNDGNGEDDGSGIARVVVPSGPQTIRVPASALGGTLRVGSVRIERTVDAQGKLCEPFAIPEGNVGFDFDENVDHSSASDYTVAIRLVLLDASPVSGAEECEPAGSTTDDAKTLLKCKRAVAKASAAFAQARLKALTGCEDDKHAGKLPQNLDCRTESDTRDAITKANATLRKTIAKACGGGDKTCGGDTTGEISPAAIGFPAVCPGFLAFQFSGCRDPIADCSGLADCLLCIDAKAVDSALVSSTSVGFADPKLQKQLNKCQRAVLKSATAFALTQDKSVHKCRDKNLQRKDYQPQLHNLCLSSVNDDAHAVSSPTRDISDGVDKMKKTICKACGGSEEKGCGGADDFTPNQIGFPMTCPGASQNQACSYVITTLDDIASCLFCRMNSPFACTENLTTPSLGGVTYNCGP
jgi:hypothetical protein